VITMSARISVPSRNRHGKVHPGEFRPGMHGVDCASCGHRVGSHKALFHDDRRFAYESKWKGSRPCRVQCHSCSKTGGKLEVCFDDGCEGRTPVNRDLASNKIAIVIKVKPKRPHRSTALLSFGD
jgi:hypothetical protein